MNHQLPRLVYFKLFTLFALLFLSERVFSQATFVSASYQTLTQQEVDVLFSQNVSFSDGAPHSTAGWTVTVAGTSVPIVSVNLFGTTVIRVKFNAQTAAGHVAGETYVKPGDAVTVSYNATGTVTSAGGVTAFAGKGAVNNWAFDCSSDIAFFQETDYVSVNQCAPVTMNFHQWQYRISLRFRNSTNYGQLWYRINWGDAGTGAFLTYQSDLTGVANASFIDAAGLGGNPNLILTARPSHAYPASIPSPAPNECHFSASVTPQMYQGATLIATCTSVAKTTIFASYSTDDKLSGALALPPPLVAGSDLVCVGNNVNMMFNDNTTLNCALAAEGTVPNQSTRWVRIVYGSQNNPAPGNIPDIRVTLPASLGGGTTVVTNNNATGTLIFPSGYYPTGAGGNNTPDGFGVIQIPSAVTAPTGTNFMGTITTTATNNQAVGQKFWVRLEYWDVCNPYSGDPTSPAPVTSSAAVTIITKPTTPTATPLTLCYGASQAGQNFNVTNTTGSTAINWYNKNPKLGGATLMTNSNGANSQNFKLSDYTVANGAVSAPINTSQAGGAGAVYSVWATYVVGATNSCESDPIEVVLIVRPQLSTPGAISGTSPLCVGSSGVAYSLAAAAPTKTIAVNNFTNSAIVSLPTQYLWSFSNGNASVASGVNAQSMTANFTGSGTTNLQVLNQYTTAPNCNTSNSILAITIDPTSVGGSVTPNRTICNDGSTTTGTLTLAGHTGAVQKWQRSIDGGTTWTDIVNTLTTFSEIPGFGAGTYMYRAVVKSGTCASANSAAATITVNPVPPQPTISQTGASTGLTICADGVQQTVLQSSNVGALAASYLWYKNGVSTGVTTSTITLNTVAQSGTYTVQVIGVAPSNCASPVSTGVVVTINPLPTAANPTGGGAVCSGNPAPDINWVLTGTGPFNVTYTMTPPGSPGGDVAVTGWAASPFTITAPNPGVATTYQIKTLIDANGCSATSKGTAASVTIGGSAPNFDTAPTLTPNSTCQNGASTTDPVLNFSLDVASTSAGSYTLSYKIDGGATSTKTFTVNLANGDLATATSFSEVALNNNGAHTVTIVSIQTPFGCQTTFNTNLSFTVNPLPAAPTGAVNGTACSTPGTGVPLSVTAPGGGLEIAWSTTTPAFTNAVPGSGAVGASPFNTFTPTTSATATYYAFTKNSATGCFSSTSLAVTQTQDLLPAAANAGPAQPNVCASTTTITLAGNVATNGGTGTWTGPGGVSFGNIHNPTSTATGFTAPAPGGAAIPTTLTWTITSAAGVCPASTSNVTITINSLPTSVDPAPQLCEDVKGGGSHAGVDLTSYNSSVTNTIAGTTVAWYSDAARTILVPAPTNVTVTNGKIFYFKATSAGPSFCVNTGTLTFTVNGLPTVVNQNLSFCEDHVGATPIPPHGNQHGPFDLTTYNTAIANGSLVNRTVAWYSDAALTTLVPTPTTYTLTGSTTLYAKVTDTSKPTNCFNTATVNLTTLARPIDNPIVGNTSVCTGNNILLYQLDPTFNPGSNYTWTVNGTPAGDVTLFGGGGTNSSNFFVLLKFPALTGTVAINVFETLNGCTGNTQTMNVVVNAAPTANTITGATQVCTNQTAVPYSVTTPNGSSTYAWTVTGATPSGSGSTINVDFGTISPVTIQVTETASSGCVGAPATLPVTVNSRPIMSSSATASVCSGSAPSLVFTSAIPSTYSWTVVSITGSITGAVVNQTGSGNLSSTFTGAGALKNTSGAVGSVTFNVIPTATAAPNCVGATQSVVVTVNPEPVLVSPQTKTICSGSQANYEILTSPLNLPAGTIFNWPIPVMSDASVQGTSGVNVAAGAPGTFHITDVLTNSSSAAITATYTITPKSGSGCNGTPQTVVVTVNPQPTISPVSPTVCSGVAIGLTLTKTATSPAINNFNITSVSIPGGLTASGSNAVIPATGVSSTYLSNDSYLNTTVGPLVVQYTAVPVTAAGCIGNSININVTINAQPSLSNSLDKSLCSGIASGLTLSTIAGSTPVSGYTVTGISIAPGLIAGGSNAIVPASNVAAGYLANDQFTNTGNTSLTVVYQVVPVSTLGCNGNPPKSITLTILPEPVIANGLNASVCSGSATGLTLNTNGTSIGAASYNITARSISPGLVANGTNAVVPATGVPAGYLASDVFKNTGNAALTVTYTVVPTSATPCTGQSKVITITINPEPVMAASAPVVCSRSAIGLTLNTNGTSVGAASYNITSRSISGGLTPNVANAAVPASGVPNNYLASDVYTNTTANPLTVTYTVVPVGSIGSCLGASQVITVTINPEPVVSTTLGGTVCSIVPIGLTLNTNGSSVAAALYNITAVSIAGGLVPGGNATVPASNVAANYLTNDTYSNTGTLPLNVVYTVVPVSAAGCLGNPQNITLTVNPEPIVSSSLNTTVCSGTVIGLTLNTNGTSVAASNYNITSVSVAVGLTPGATNAVVPASNVVPTYLSGDKYTNTSNSSLTVNYTVVPLSAAGCPGPSKTITITINPEPVMSSSLNDTECSDVAIGLTLNTNGSSVAAATYNVTGRTVAGGLSVGGSNATVPATGVAANYLANDLYTNKNAIALNVTYTVVPVSALGCVGASKTITITINPEPVLSTTLNNTLCSSTITNLTLNTNGTSVAASNYNITNLVLAPGLTADGANAAIPAVGVSNTYLANDKFVNTTAGALTATYTIVPVSASSCLGNPATVVMTINPEPVVSNALDATVCSDVATALTLNTNGTSVAALNYNITARTIAPGLVAAGTNATVPATAVAAGYLAGDKFNNVTANPLNVTYTVVPVSGVNCTGTPKVITIKINPKPVLSSTLDMSWCSAVATGLTLATNGTSVAAQNYNITAISMAPGLTAGGSNAAIPATGVAAGYLASDKFTNTTSGNLNVVYTVVPVSAAGCAGVPVNVTVTIQPQPVVATTLNTTLCSGQTIGLTLNTNGTSVAAANYNITARAISGGLVAAGSNAVVPATGVVAGYLANDIFTNTTNSALTVNYTIVPVSALNCQGAPQVVTITINPEPVVASGLNATVCSGSNIGLTLNTNGTSVAAATYSITSRTIAPGLTAAGTNVAVPASNVAANYLSTDKFTNTGSLPLTVTYTVVPFSGVPCQGASKTITITINPEPVVASGLDKTICSGLSTGLTLNTNGTSVAAGSYNILSITIGGTLTASVGNAVVPATGVAANYLAGDVFKNTSNTPFTVTYIVAPVSAATCVGANKTITVTVNPEPVGSTFTDPLCATTLNHDISTQITNGVNSVFTYTVTSDNVGVPAAANRAVASAAPITDSYTNNTGTPATLTYTITPFSVANNCQGATFTYIVKVSPTPVGANATQAALCSRSAININPQTKITNGVVSTFTWTAIYDTNLTGGTGSGTGNITDNLVNQTGGVLNATYTVTPSSGPCPGLSFTITQPINPEPVMDPGLATKTVCSNNASSSNPINIVLNTNGVSVAASTYNVSLVSQDAGLTGSPTTGVNLSANAIKNDVFNNVGAVPLKVTYQITPKSAAGCFGVPFNIAVTVNPEPVLAALSNTVCSREVTNLILATSGTSVGAAQYKLISVTVPGTITANASNTVVGSVGGVSLIKNDSYTNTTSAAKVVTYSILGISASGCQGVPVTMTITVNPEPILVPGASAVCSGVPSGIVLGTAVGSAAITQYNLKQVLTSAGITPSGTNAGLGTYAANNFLASDVFTNTTSSPLTVTYTIAPVAGGCVGTDQTVVLTVNPAPALANLNTTVCSTNSSGILLSTQASSVPAANYNITSVVIQAGLSQTAGNTGARVGVANTEIQGDKFTNATNGTLTVTYTIVPVTGASCQGPATAVVLTVEPTITATPVNNAPSICSNGVTNIVLNSPTTPSSGSVSFNYTAVSSVGGLLSGFIPAASNLPMGYTIADNLVNTSNSPATVTYKITPIANGAKNGTGCSGATVNVVVTVDPLPKLVASPAIQTICEGTASNISLTSPTVPSAGSVQFIVSSVTPTGGMTLTSPAVAVTTYTSGQSIADVWSNPTTTQQTVTYVLQPVVSGGLGCSGNSVTITLNVNPAPVVTTSIINPTISPAAICSTDLVNISLSADVSGTINSWTASVTSGASSGQSNGAGDLIFQTLKNSGTVAANVRYHITPKASGCSGSPVDIDIKVDPIPNVAFTAPASVCYGSTLNVPLTSAVAGTTFTWVADTNNSGVDTNPGSGLTINQVVQDTLTSAEDFISYTITAIGPGATACASTPKVMSLLASPKMDGAFQNDSTWLCTGSKDFLQIALKGQAPFTLGYTDGTTNFTSTNVGNFKSIQIQPAVSTTYKLTSLKDNLGCSIPLTDQVVYTVGLPSAAYSIISPLATCTPDLTSFQFNQVAGTSYTWQWGDGSDSTFVASTSVANKVIKHNFINTSLTSSLKPNIVLTASLNSHFPNGCAKTSTKTITVYAQLKTKVSVDKSQICSGDQVRLTNQTVGVLTTGNTWFYRDQGNVGQQEEVKTSINANYTLSIDATKSNPQVIEILYHADNGHCPADTTIKVSVYKSIKADFDYTATHFLMGTSVATFTNKSLEQGTPDWTPFRFDWDYGLGATPATQTSSASPLTVNYSSPGNRVATLTATNIDAETAGLTCVSTVTKTISILLDPLVAKFKVDPIFSCFPTKVNVTENLATGDRYKWAVIDKLTRDTVASSNALLPVFSISSEGSYLVYLLTSSSLTGQTASDTTSILLYGKPQAIFDVFPRTVYVPDQEITTVNGSGNSANKYLWDFGDGGTSTEYQPKYKYKFEGVDSLKFTATYVHPVHYKDGSSDTVKCSATTFKLITAKQGGVAKVPNAFTPSTAGPSGGVGGVDLYNYVFLPQVKGVEEFNMQVYDRWGNLVFESNNQTIGWDGYDQNGRLMPAGVYVYKLTLRLSDQQRTTQVGDVTLIR